MNKCLYSNFAGITKHIPPSYHYPSSSSSAIRHVVPIQAAPRGYMPVYARPFVPNPLPQIQIRHPPPIGVRRNVVVKQNPKNCQG
ncbi:unnamed protein product [Caenorhabditis angaria]|uniref:Uncharacterized protein n=1 Tax=Caenorhabditis angaria TaxID=860376 RepID=A0A9P1MT71_9PELO|nr:unnamed protein product [Caenorhabditis angaria]